MNIRERIRRHLELAARERTIAEARIDLGYTAVMLDSGRTGVALITATSIVNHSMDEFIPAASNCREVALLGPTTPLLPDVFRDTPVTCLSGVVVSNPEQVLRVVSCPGGMRQLKRFVDKVNLPLS